jgi:hypothetical protein
LKFEKFETYQWLNGKFDEQDNYVPTEAEYKQAEVELVTQINDGLNSQRFDKIRINRNFNKNLTILGY